MQIRISDIRNSLIIAIDRTGSELLDIERMIKDISDEFHFMKDSDIIQAIRNGSLGMYGPTYRFCTQIVCIWIREYLKSKKPTLGI